MCDGQAEGHEPIFLCTRRAVKKQRQKAQVHVRVQDQQQAQEQQEKEDVPDHREYANEEPCDVATLAAVWNAIACATDPSSGIARALEILRDATDARRVLTLSQTIVIAVSMDADARFMGSISSLLAHVAEPFARWDAVNAVHLRPPPPAADAPAMEWLAYFEVVEPYSIAATESATTIEQLQMLEAARANLVSACVRRSLCHDADSMGQLLAWGNWKNDVTRFGSDTTAQLVMTISTMLQTREADELVQAAARTARAAGFAGTFLHSPRAIVLSTKALADTLVQAARLLLATRTLPAVYESASMSVSDDCARASVIVLRGLVEAARPAGRASSLITSFLMDVIASMKHACVAPCDTKSMWQTGALDDARHIICRECDKMSRTDRVELRRIIADDKHWAMVSQL